jgi:hypothetical protein
LLIVVFQALKYQDHALIAEDLFAILNSLTTQNRSAATAYCSFLLTAYFVAAAICL